MGSHRYQIRSASATPTGGDPGRRRLFVHANRPRDRFAAPLRMEEVHPPPSLAQILPCEQDSNGPAVSKKLTIHRADPRSECGCGAR
jgi:hypothetical protein